MRARFKSVKSKIILLFVLLAVFQICVMAGFAKFHLTPKIVSMYSEHLDRFSDTILGETVSEKEKIETYMVNIIGDSLIQRYLDAESRQAEETPDMPESSELRNRILSYTDYDNSITAIYLTDNYGNIYSNGSQTEMTSFLKRHPELAYRKDASAVWYTEDRTGDIVVYRIVNNNTTDLNRKIGALCLFIDRDMFEERLDHLLMEEDQHYLLISDDRCFFLTSGNRLEIQKGDIVSQKEIEGWYLKTWIEHDTAYAAVDMMMQILMGELLVLLVISIGLAVFLSGRITRPMKKIEIAMKKIGSGDMDIEVQDEDEDEMGRLAVTLNTMAASIKKLMRQIQEDEEQKRYLELKAMQYQINPHFLYNTLDSVAMSARKNQDLASENMILALSDFFRISLSHGVEYVKIKTEIQYVETYLKIQSMRFPEQIEWKCTVDPGLENVMILKCIVQPLVENSLYHGFRDVDRHGMIRICVSSENGQLRIKVADDGAGIAPEKLRRLREEIHTKYDTEKDIYEGGFGLQNVQQRLEIVYGEKAGLEIESEWDEGTSITIMIPFDRIRSR